MGLPLNWEIEQLSRTKGLLTPRMIGHPDDVTNSPDAQQRRNVLTPHHIDLLKSLKQKTAGEIRQHNQQMEDLATKIRREKKYEALRNDRARLTACLPDSGRLVGLVRYETMLDLQLYRAMRELTRRQDRRNAARIDAQDPEPIAKTPFSSS